MKRWLNTALALVLMLAIAAGGFFLPNLVSARLDRRNQDAEFSLSTGDEQSPATVLRLKLTDGIQNLGASEEPPIALDESAAAHTRDDMTRYAQTFLTALYKDCELFGADFTVDGVSVDYASYGSGFVLWSITLSDPRGDSVTLLLDDTTGCPLAIGYSFADSYAFQLEQNGLWSYLLRVFENRIAVTISAALGATYDEVQIPMPDAAKKCSGCPRAAKPPSRCGCSTPGARTPTSTAMRSTTCSFTIQTPTRSFPCRRGTPGVRCCSTPNGLAINDAVLMPKRCRTDHSLR